MHSCLAVSRSRHTNVQSQFLSHTIGTVAARTLAPVLGRPPVISTLICGMLGGCGGGFMPLDKGLAPLANGLNW